MQPKIKKFKINYSETIKNIVKITVFKKEKETGHQPFRVLVR